MRPAPFNQEELQAATYATLRAHPTSEQAKLLVTKLSSMVEEYTMQAGLRQKKRRGSAGKLEYATGAFVADLLQPYEKEDHPSNGWVYRSLKKTSFTGAPVGRHAFEQLLNGFEGLGFLEHVPGHKVSDERSDTGRYAARFRATPQLLSFCSEHGVPPVAVLDHFEFEYDLPKHPIERRARKEKNWFAKTVPPGRAMEFERTDFVERMENSIRELNAFFAEQKLRGGSHHGYVRIFSNGDDPDFEWDKGGRFYSQHFPSYQSMSGEQRRRMTINEEPVAEIDIRASYLTIFLSMHGIQIDLTKDPYEVPGFPEEHRDAVKQWFVATFGNTKPIRRWPPRMLKDHPELSQYPVADIKAAVLSKYPTLATWGEPIQGRTISWADLMFIESEVMFGAMLNLMHIHHTPSLSVHDSLIVPVSKVEEAREAIELSLHGKNRVYPILKTNPPLPREGH